MDFVRFGPATAAIIEKNNISPRLYGDLHGYYKDIPHEDWFWHLLNDTSLEPEVARSIVQAMHIDTGVIFDEETCLHTFGAVE